MLPLISATVVFLLAALAEWLHVRRIRVVARLAFGPEGRARSWTHAVPWLRALSLAALAWGLVTLLTMRQLGDDAAGANRKPGEPTRLVFVGDLSPSMYL